MIKACADRGRAVRYACHRPDTVPTCVSVSCRLHSQQLFKPSGRKTQYFTNSCSSDFGGVNPPTWQLYVPLRIKSLGVLFRLEFKCLGTTKHHGNEKTSQRTGFSSTLHLRDFVTSVHRKSLRPFVKRGLFCE